MQWEIRERCAAACCTGKILVRNLCFREKEPGQNPLNSAYIPSVKEGNCAVNFSVVSFGQ